MKHRHLPLHLPLYHPDLKLVNLVWGEIKGKVAHLNIGSSSLQQKEKLTKFFFEYSSIEVLITHKKRLRTNIVKGMVLWILK